MHKLHRCSPRRLPPLIYGDYPWPNMNALAGNRTPVSSVAGENSTTEPPMQSKVDWSVSDISVKVPSQFKAELILPLFEGKGLETHNKDNYHGIAMFSVFCKVFEMILLRKLEQIAEKKWYFSHMQFGFSEGVGCLEASYVISESINQLLEKGGKVFTCFLDVHKAFDTVWIPGLLYKLKHELGIDSQLWLVI